jgi:hypothetical protein
MVIDKIMDMITSYLEHKYAYRMHIGGFIAKFLNYYSRARL